MATYRELVYMCLDLLKQASDDTYYTEDHIIFLLDKFRSLLLDQRYTKLNIEVAESNYQTLCLDMVNVERVHDLKCMGTLLKSVQKIPQTLNIGSNSIYPTSYFTDVEITFVNPERFRFIGYNKWLRNIIYATEFDDYLYINSGNPSYRMLNKVTFRGVFENTREAAKNSCDNSNICNIMDMEYPIEELLQASLIELVVKELAGGLYKPKDDENNAKDDDSDLHTFIARNVKSNLQKQIEQ